MTSEEEEDALFAQAQERALSLLQKLRAKREAWEEARGWENAISELLGRLFARKFGRRPPDEETRSIVERSRAIGAGEVEDALLDLERDALLRWLAEPVQRS